MRVLIHFLFCLLFGSLSTFALVAQGVDNSPLPAREKAWIAAKIYQSVHTYFAHWEGVPDLDFEASFEQYLDEAYAAEDRYQFDLASLAFLARLENGHTSFSDRRLSGSPPLGFFLNKISGQWVVTETRVESLSLGDVVQSIDQQPITEFVAEASRYVAASSTRSRQRKVFFRSYLWPESFQLRLDDGRTVPIDRHRQELQPAEGRSWKAEILEDQIGYLNIPSFGNPSNESRAVEFIQENNEMLRGLVIDVRGNGGGNTPSDLIRALMDRPYNSFSEATTMDFALFKAYNRISELTQFGQLPDRTKGFIEAFEYFKQPMLVAPGGRVEPENPVFTGPLFILIDERCASACEDFLLPFKVTDRARLVGSTTVGSTGQPYLYDFGNGMSFRVSSKRVYLPGGLPFEGVGIEPDVKAQPGIEDLRAGEDPLLKMGITLVKEEIRAGSR